MKTLNLVYPEKSDIKYKISKFPDGQQQVAIDKESLSETIPGLMERVYYANCLVKTRINNFSDLEILICAVKSLRGLGIKTIDLYAPYFLGSRSDRKFGEGDNNYLKDVICPIINSLNLETVMVMDPHSDILEACLNNFVKVDNRRVVEFFLASANIDSFDKIIFLSPDAGALKKIYKVTDQVGYKGQIVVCSKSRDEDGKLTKTIVPYSRDEGDLNKDYVIVDDICDGGATFLNIAKEIRKHEMFTGKIHLVVTHGIFSKGFAELEKYFDSVYCTNSYKDIFDTTILCGPKSTRNVGNLVKQCNIF